MYADVRMSSFLLDEMDAHLKRPDEQSNRRNGHTTKNVRTKSGTVEIKNPRDRDGTFSPVILPKRKTILNESLDDKILSPYALDMSYTDIAAHMDEMYDVELSKSTLSAITDTVSPVIREWQGRQPDEVYCFVWMDAFVIKVKEEGCIRKKGRLVRPRRQF